MYNKDRKELYINDNMNTTDNVKNFLTSLFNKTSEIEFSNKLDVADFTVDEIRLLFKWMNSKSRPYLRLVSYHLERYYNWCVAEGYVEATNIKNLYDYDITSDIIEQVIPADRLKNKFFGKDYVLSILDKVYDKTTRFIVYAIFMGIYGEKGEDLTNLRLEDIDISKKCAKLKSGRIVKVDKKFIELAKEADAQVCYYESEYSLGNTRSNNVYVESPYIIKVCRSRYDTIVMSEGTVGNRIKTVQLQTKNRFITVNTLYFNGMVSYILENMLDRGIELENIFNLSKIGSEKKFMYKEILDSLVAEFGGTMEISQIKYRIKDNLDDYIS